MPQSLRQDVTTAILTGELVVDEMAGRLERTARCFEIANSVLLAVFDQVKCVCTKAFARAVRLETSSDCISTALMWRPRSLTSGSAHMLREPDTWAFAA